MAYANERAKPAREHIWYIEFTSGSATFRFCQDRNPIPAGLNAQPTLIDVNVSPAEIDLTGGIGVRSSVSMSIMEHMDHTVWGTVTEPVRFWSRWRAQYPYYKGVEIRVYSGYITDGNQFDINNFEQRKYLIESWSYDGGMVKITAKDPLKMASNDRAKAPVESLGSLAADILSTDTSFDLAPSGIGSTYPSSNFYVRVGDEVMLCTSRSSDTLTVTRAQYNTVADDHSQDDIVQECLEYDAETVADINYDLLTTYAGVSTSYINKTEWDAENSSAFTTTYSAFITEPTGVTELIRELSQSAPNYMYWDERSSLIRFVALKPPTTDATLLTYEDNLLENKLSVADMQGMRVSTVVVLYGIFNPTKDLDEPSNYRAKYVREDTDSVTNYDGRAYKTIYSRWITNDNKTAAVLVAARIGRRFADAPRMIGFAVDAKDGSLWTGDAVKVQSDVIQAAGGSFPALNYQILSAQEGPASFIYKALEHTYGDSLPQDEDAEDPNVRLIYLNGNLDQLKDDSGTARTLRDLYDDVYPSDFDTAYDIRFIFEVGCVAGSSTNSQPAVQTGTFPGLVTPILIDMRGLLVGKGGKGADVGGSAQNGGVALSLDDDIRLDNTGIIGGGGGGGGARTNTVGSSYSYAAGGGGAGYTNGLAGNGTIAVGTLATWTQPENSTNTEGGLGGTALTAGAEPTSAVGGFGGDLGNAGNGPGAGSAGAAINRNGNTITYINTGDIRGDINA